MEEYQIIHKPKHFWNAEIIAQHEQDVIIKQLSLNPASRKQKAMIPIIQWFFQREARLLTQISRQAPGITPKVLVLEPNKIILERLTGPTFFECRTTLPGQEELYNKLVVTLQQLHQAGFAHGELRLGNIMINNNDVLLIDFSTAISQSSLFFHLLKMLDLFALEWIKEHVFKLDLHEHDVQMRRQYSLVYWIFSQSYLAHDIPFR